MRNVNLLALWTKKCGEKRLVFFCDELAYLRDGLVFGKHGENDGLCGLVKDGQDLCGRLGKEVGEDVTLGGQDVVVHLEAASVLLAHGPDLLLVQAVASLVNVGPETF